MSRDVYNWSRTYLLEGYNSIKFQDQIPPSIIDVLRHDLQQILIVPSKNEKSRNLLLGDTNSEFNVVKLSNGEEFKLNKSFIEATILLSSQLNLDELATAELLLNAENLKYNTGINFQDSGKLSFFQRYDYILNILGYLISNQQLELLTTDYELIFNNVLKSFDKIYELLKILNDLIDKQKLTNDINNLTFINSIIYMKKQLFNEHELLSSILFQLLSTYHHKFNKFENFKKLTTHINKNIANDDILIVHYLPSLFEILTNLEKFEKDLDVFQFHSFLANNLNTDYKKILLTENEDIDLSKSSIHSYEILLYLVFFTKLIRWSKQTDERMKKIDFKDDILKYLYICINYGSMDKLLCVAADTTASTIASWNNLYDFRSLLQKNFPKLIPSKFIYTNNNELLNEVKLKPGFENVKTLCDYSIFKVSNDFNNSLLAPFFHDFFSNFIDNAAVVLTQLRDNEEDFLLSSINKKQLEFEESRSKVNTKKFDDFTNNDDDYDHFTNYLEKISSSKKKSSKSNGDVNSLDLDEISVSSDLERFYLAFVYIYSDRPELCSMLWESEDLRSEILGFVNWGLSNNTSPLITSTFCLLLASLASGGSEISSRVWEILVHNNYSNTSTSTSGTFKKHDYSKISVDSIIDSLNYYVNSLIENFENDLIAQLKLQQKRQDFLFSSSFNTSIDSNQPSVDDKIVIELAEDSIVFISGFFQLITSIVKNLSSKFARSREIKNICFNRFFPLITRFLKFDNLIIASKNVQINQSTSSNQPLLFNSNGNSSSSHSSSSSSSKVDSLNIVIDDDNRTVLVNLVLNLLSSFAENEDDLTLRYKIWDIVDRWICHSINDISSSNSSAITAASNLIGGTNSNSQTRNELGFPNHESSPFKLKYQNKKVRNNQGFLINLNHLSQVGNFVSLLKTLLTPLNDKNLAFKNYKLLYPPEFGVGYRLNNQIGIWPYIEYLLLEVFAKSIDLKEEEFESRYHLQYSILEIINNSLNEVDWPFINDLTPSIINNLENLNGIIDNHNNTLDYQLYVRLHHSLAVMNYLFDEKANKTLFDIISIGNDRIVENERLSSLVFNALTVVESILKLQDTFINGLLPALGNKDIAPSSSGVNSNSTIGFGTSMSLALSTPRSIYDTIYYRKVIGSNGVSNFYEVLLFNLLSVVQFALYVGNPNQSLANLAIKLLKDVSKSSYFMAKTNGGSLLSKNRLLTIFEAIDESTKIQHAFIDQLDNFEDNLLVILNILNFLNDNISATSKEPSVSHFLLGYNIKGGILRNQSKQNGNSVFKCLLKLLNYALDSISDIDYINGYDYRIDVGPAKLSSLILDIIVKLCRNPNSSNITLKYLRESNDYDLFTRLINCQPKIISTSVWYDSIFDGDLIDDGKYVNKFLTNELNQEAFFSFIKYRNLILQYLSLEIHNVSSNSKKEYYIKLLLNDNEFLKGSPKILNFFDILNFDFYNFESSKYQKFDQKYSLVLLLEEFRREKVENIDGLIVSQGNETRDTILNKIFKIICSDANNRLPTKDLKVIFSQGIMEEASKIEEFLTKYLIQAELKSHQLSCLHSWVQVMQVLITDGIVKRKSDFILEILQLILPKINDYFETQILFAEELISLCVLLFDVYEQENLAENGEQKALYIEKMVPLFKTCINGILCTNSTPTLRSDLYILSNKFLQKNFDNESLFQQILDIFKSLDKRFIDTICNDSIYSEGSPRITSIIFLESLIHLSSLSKVNSNYILELIIKNNSLLLLVRSIKRTDEMLSLCHSNDKDSEINLETLLYELTAFKCTLYLLIRISQTRLGAGHLIQNEIFPILKQLAFLSVDPDLGLDIKLTLNKPREEKKTKEQQSNGEEISMIDTLNNANVTINLSLDVPISFDKQYNHIIDKRGVFDANNNQLGTGGSDSESNISYYEFLVPVFQLVVGILLSMGPSYKPSIFQIREFMKHFNRLIVGVIKRDVLAERNEAITTNGEQNQNISEIGLQELVKLVTLLDALVHQNDN